MHPEAHSRIEEGRFVDIRGIDQWITLRGDDLRNPPLLIVPGPGAGMCSFATLFAPWERCFVIAQWDQPRAGVTHARHAGDTPGEFSLSRLVDDELAVCEWLGRRLGGRRVALLALSGGTILGLKMIKQRPELFSAYIGTGQITNWARQESLGYQMILERARQCNDGRAIAELESIGQPPYASTAIDAIKSRYCADYSPAERAAFAALVAVSVIEPAAEASYVPAHLPPNKDVGAIATAAYDALRDEIQSFDAEHLGLDFSVPMTFFQGELDAVTVSSEVQRYAARIRTPHTLYVPIAAAGHSPWIVGDVFLTLLEKHVRPILTG